MLTALIVEDDNNKLRYIVRALGQVPGCRSEDFDVAPNANAAKLLLKQKLYDLLVLDIALPPRADEFPDPNGGLKLLHEILHRDTQFNRPQHVVGLTAFPDILNNVASRFAEDLWMVILYDPASSQWSEQLQRKAEYILLAKRSEPLPEHGAYLGLVAALSEPELSTLIETVPWNWKQTQVPSDASCYWKGMFLAEGEEREVVAVAAPRMGMTAASIASMKLISAFQPRYLAVIGIAAGVAGQCKLGDVVVADPCWDWGSGKIKRGKFEQAPHQIGLDSFTRSKLARLSQDHEMLDSIRRQWTGSSIDHVLRLEIGPVASGASVLADEKVVQGIQLQHRKTTAIDMEIYGVYASAQECTLPQPKVFSMKGICDYANPSKNDEYQRYAAFTSAQVLKVFAEKYLGDRAPHRTHSNHQG
jgi:nucleoside phosphorylase